MRAVCRVCGIEKDVTEFRKNYRNGPYEDWNLRQCKQCTHEQYLVRREDHDSYEKLKVLNRAWKKANPERHAEMAREYRRRHPEQTKAQNRLNYAIRCGRITRLPCENCGTTERVQAHHVSYRQEDWLNVNWYCQPCHKKKHMEENAASGT